MTQCLYEECRRGALVPEHSAAFMQAVSGGTPLLEQQFLFLHAADWLMAIGYPLSAKSPVNVSEMAECAADAATSDFDKALNACVKRTGAARCFAIAPVLPERLRQFQVDQDSYYLLSVDAAIPASLRGSVAKAAKRLTITEHREFTPSHRRLWGEFLGRVTMQPNIRELYARTESALAASRAAISATHGISSPGSSTPLLDLRLLSAWERSA